MKIDITCISHNRRENVQKLFEQVGHDEIVFFVKDQKDKEEYISAGAKRVEASGSLMRSRNAALDFSFERGNICLQLSDDLTGIEINDFSGKRTKEPCTVQQAIDEILPKFLKMSEEFAGLPPTSNPYFAMKENEHDKFIVGDFIIVKPNPLRFDENMRLKEDYDYTLQHIKHREGTVRFNKFLASFKHYSNKGGAVDYRTENLEQETIRYLHGKWGECIKLNAKRPNEILLAKNLKKLTQQNSLF